MDKHPIDVAAEILGSQAALAGALGVTKAAVNQWKGEGRRTPAEHCPHIERLTGGRVRCEDLRPDVAWDVLRMQASPPENGPSLPAREHGAALVEKRDPSEKFVPDSWKRYDDPPNVRAREALESAAPAAAPVVHTEAQG